MLKYMETEEWIAPGVCGSITGVLKAGSEIVIQWLHNASNVYLIYVCDLPAVVQHCSICTSADGTSICGSSTTSTVCALLEEDIRILGTFMIGLNIME